MRQFNDVIKLRLNLYGLRLGVLGENAELNPGIQFAGQWLDEESGLLYNRFRYYSAVAGCYLTPDPIGLLGGKNPYSYVHNPTGWTDPLGFSRKCGKGFSSADDAARAALNKYNPMSLRMNKEYGGIIFKAKDGSYGYTRGMLGKSRTAPTFKETSKRLPEGSTPVGQYHTHGDYADDAFKRTNKAGDVHNSDNFSPADIRIHNAASRTFPGFINALGTPSGQFKKITGFISHYSEAIHL
ncbi:DUF4329 domain-containing protein [Xenorhabdus bovienii]|nr:DUF4329 domain-containing protein [Xenorhabdus bovienii]MDE9463411.1 DUF4329 domain-containing protein [Xenorhabdus bovienii]MDE9471198.1 DUF4329 domain-containing protein [Xenorhabdus bovienii]